MAPEPVILEIELINTQSKELSLAAALDSVMRSHTFKDALPQVKARATRWLAEQYEEGPF